MTLSHKVLNKRLANIYFILTNVLNGDIPCNIIRFSTVIFPIILLSSQQWYSLEYYLALNDDSPRILPGYQR